MPFSRNAAAFKPKLRVTSFLTRLHKAQMEKCLFPLNNKRTNSQIGLHHLDLIQSSP